MTANYFSDLNYSLGNEDTTLEVELVLALRPSRILSIAGCGSRAIPLLCCEPKELICVDVASQQIAITELREASVRTLTFDEFRLFWGFPPFSAFDYSKERKNIFNDLVLTQDTREYFEKLFSKVSWGSILYEGKWEKTFGMLAKAVRLIFGKKYDQIFEHHDLSSQLNFYNNKFPIKKWKSIIFLLGNKSVFNALLYKGDFIKKNIYGSHFDYYFRAFDSLFHHTLARNSFFANLCFYGRINHEDGNTIEADPGVFASCQKALNREGSKVFYENTDLLSAASKYLEVDGNGLDFISLSDVPSYFSGELEQNFLQQLRPSLNPGAVLVLRSYLREPQAALSGFEDITPKFGQAIQLEKVQMYHIKILQYEP